MADPAQAAAAGGIGGSVGQGVVGSLGAMLQGRSQTAMYHYQAGVAAINAAVAKQDAIYATQAGETSAEESGMRTRFDIGRTRTAFSAGNVDTSTGSPRKVVSSEVAIGQENEGIIRSNAAKQAYGFNVKAASDIAQEGADYAAAKTSGEAETYSVASSIIGGVTGVSGKWTQAAQAFGTGTGNNTNDENLIYGPGY